MSWDLFTEFGGQNSKPKRKDRIKKEEPDLFQEQNTMATSIINAANSISFDVPESKSKRKGRIKKDEPVLFQEGDEILQLIATDAEVSRYYEVKGRLGQSYGIWNASVQMETFRQLSPQEKDNIRQTVKNELPKLEEQLEARTKSIQYKCSSRVRSVVEAENKKKEENKKANSMATDADIFWYYEVRERLCNYNGANIQKSRAPQQMESFRQMAPQQSDDLRRQVKIELPKLEEQLKKNKQNEKEEREALRETEKKARKDAEIRFQAQRESRIKAQERLNRRKEEEDFERRFKEEEKEKRYQEFKKNKSGLGLAAASNEALPVAVAIAVPISVPILVVESSSFALKNKLWVSGR